MKNKIVIIVTKQNIRFYTIMIAMVVIVLLSVMIAFPPSSYITFEGVCQKMDGRNITINSVTFLCAFSFSDYDRDMFLDSEIRFRARYNEDTNCWWWSSITPL